MVEIRPGDAGNVAPFLDRHNALRAARLGRLENSLDHPSFVAVRDGRVVGVATYVIDGDSCELLTLHVDDRFRGIGTALVDAVVAAAEGCSRLWLITTNDNTDAIRLYQRDGWEWCDFHRDAVANSRTLKPELPETGAHGIPIKHEIEFEYPL